MVHYSYQQKVFRYLTKVKFTENFNGNKFTHLEKDYKDLNKTLTAAKTRVDNIVSDYVLKYGKKPPVQFLKDTLASKTDTVELKYQTFNELYDIFFTEKSEDTAIRKPSLKDYTSFKNAVMYYQHLNKITLTVEQINTKHFYHKFEKFLFTDPGFTKEELKKWRFRGKQSNPTVQKRGENLRTFINWLVEKEILEKNKLRGVDSSLAKYDREIIIYSDEELKQMIKLELEANDEKIRDLAIFTSFTGLRYSDAISLNKYNVKDGYLLKYAQKVTDRFQVKLVKEAAEILKKWDYNLNFYSNQHFNRELKKFLKKYDICTELREVIKFVGNKPVKKEAPKYKFCHSHTGRRTFLGRGIKLGVPLSVLMKASGHKDVKTLFIYIDLFGKDAADDFIDRLSF